MDAELRCMVKTWASELKVCMNCMHMMHSVQHEGTGRHVCAAAHARDADIDSNKP